MEDNKAPGNTEIDLKRIEDKFILPKDEIDDVKEMVGKHIPEYSHDPGANYTINRSIYFDSPDLTFFKQHLNGLGERRKIRIRTYYPDGVPNHIYFIEIKSKNDGDSTKTRVQLSELGYEYVMKNNEIKLDEDLYITNEEVPKDQVTKHANVINYLLTLNKCTPVVDITYKRCAYQENEKFRVTIDEEIKCRPLRYINLSTIQDLRNQDLWDDIEEYKDKFSNDKNFLLEVKYNNEYEKWFEMMIKGLDVEETGFSKYVWALSNILDDTLSSIKKGLKK